MFNSIRSHGNIGKAVPPGPPNRGQILINPNFLANSGAYEFLNLMKHATNWYAIDLGAAAGAFTSNNLNANGYPTAVSGSGAACNLLLTTASGRATAAGGLRKASVFIGND